MKPSQIKPKGLHLFVKVDGRFQKKDGGIMLPDEIKYPHLQVSLVAAGEQVKKDLLKSNINIPVYIVHPNAGIEVMPGYRIIHQEEVLLVLI